ncbi:hypothetical protein BC834DRAFT_972683 [Gloeopeniophorella convolvens]|nr:hypothetical protein BC834DRAFT_972683 [Gloeopeniophorella convolvens]
MGVYVVIDNHTLPTLTTTSHPVIPWYATHRLQQPTEPLLRTRHADVPLRAENLYALALSGAGADDLLTADELPAGAPPTAHYALLDHNVLAERFAADEGARVVAVIDHHADEGRHLDAAPRGVEVPTGSCASLVARLMQRERLAGTQRGVAWLLLCAALVDTGGLRAGGKAEAADRGVAPFLLERESVDHLGARDPLRRWLWKGLEESEELRVERRKGKKYIDAGVPSAALYHSTAALVTPW